MVTPATRSQDEGNDSATTAGIVAEVTTVVTMLSQRPHGHLKESRSHEQASWKWKQPHWCADMTRMVDAKFLLNVHSWWSKRNGEYLILCSHNFYRVWPIYEPNSKEQKSLSLRYPRCERTIHDTRKECTHVDNNIVNNKDYRLPTATNDITSEVNIESLKLPRMEYQEYNRITYVPLKKWWRHWQSSPQTHLLLLHNRSISVDQC